MGRSKMKVCNILILIFIALDEDQFPGQNHSNGTCGLQYDGGTDKCRSFFFACPTVVRFKFMLSSQQYVCQQQFLFALQNIWLLCLLLLFEFAIASSEQLSQYSLLPCILLPHVRQYLRTYVRYIRMLALPCSVHYVLADGLRTPDTRTHSNAPIVASLLLAIWLTSVDVSLAGQLARLLQWQQG